MFTFDLEYFTRFSAIRQTLNNFWTTIVKLKISSRNDRQVQSHILLFVGTYIREPSFHANLLRIASPSCNHSPVRHLLLENIFSPPKNSKEPVPSIPSHSIFHLYLPAIHNVRLANQFTLSFILDPSARDYTFVCAPRRSFKKNTILSVQSIDVLVEIGISKPILKYLRLFIYSLYLL